jgi:hypothetical protein
MGRFISTWSYLEAVQSSGVYCKLLLPQTHICISTRLILIDTGIRKSKI